MSTQIPKDALTAAVSVALGNAVEKIVAEEAEAAAQRVRERVAAETGHIVAQVSAQVSYLSDAQDFIIRFNPRR